MAAICRCYGYHTPLEYIYKCPVFGLERQIRYRVDVRATRGDREIIIEINGPGGHSTRQSYDLAGPKFLRIRETHGKKPWRKDKGIEVYVKTFSQMAKWLDEEIAQEIMLDKHNPSLFPPPHQLHRRHLVDRSHPK